MKRLPVLNLVVEFLSPFQQQIQEGRVNNPPFLVRAAGKSLLPDGNPVNNNRSTVYRKCSIYGGHPCGGSEEFVVSPLEGNCMGVVEGDIPGEEGSPCIYGCGSAAHCVIGRLQ
jgi:hypothetical protein